MTAMDALAALAAVAFYGGGLLVWRSNVKLADEPLNAVGGAGCALMALGLAAWLFIVAWWLAEHVVVTIR